MAEAQKETAIDYSKVFNIRIWEGVQYKLSKVLGIAIKVMSEDGSINTEESNFSEFYKLLMATPAGKKSTSIDMSKIKEDDTYVILHSGLKYYRATTYFYGKRFSIFAGVCEKTAGDAELKKISDETGVDLAELKSAYAEIPVVAEERLTNLSDLIVDLFNIVIELSVQEYITHLANKQKEEEIAKMSALMDASIIINSTRNLKQLLRIIMQSAEKVMLAEASSVFLIDNESNELFFEVATGPKEEEVKKIRLKMGEGIAGWVAYTGESLLVPDVARDPRFARRVDDQTHFITRCVICVPLKVRNQTIGVVQVLNKIGGGEFNKSEIKFLEALASQAAIAIENANLYEHLEERAEQLNAELKKANVELSIEKGRIESILQSMEDAVLAVDGDKKLVMANRVAERIFEISVDEAVGRPVEEFMKTPEMLATLTTVLAVGSINKNEIKIELAGKEHIFAAVFAPIIDERRKAVGCVVVFRDVTEIKELDKMKSEFLNMVSHELRTPLTPIQAYSELMMVRKFDEAKIKNYAGIINKETQRLGALIGDLLDLSRIESGKGLSLSLEELDFRELLASAHETFVSSSAKHKFILTNPDNCEKITVDKNKMIQVMTNLLSNALKYSPEGGEINIALEDMPEGIKVSVADQGMGISNEDLPHIFDKFYRAGTEQVKKIGGTGIGLPIVKYILELHNGTIDVKSEVGKGSVFSFFIPRIKQK